MKQTLLYYYERHALCLFFYNSEVESIRNKTPSGVGQGISGGGDRFRQQKGPIDAPGMRSGLGGVGIGLD